MRLERRTAEEVLVGRRAATERGGEQQTGLHRREVGVELAREGPVALLEAQRLDGVVAGVGQPQVGAGLLERVVHGARVGRPGP